ncbi:ABZJ_00895 family protein [Roseovarius sp. B08]|uniref:ABZJ_00895 family protein n=1 Tax=Roseovarius sp. B08 TaxID=3449223 RepID=UPI003EDB88DA
MTWLRYGVVFLAVAIGVAQVVRLLDITKDEMLGSAAQIMVPAMIAALIEGQQYVRRHAALPGSGGAWRFAFIAMGVATVLNVALTYAGPTVAPEFAKLAIAAPGSQQFVTLLLMYAGGYLLANRFFFGIGAGNTMSRDKARNERPGK